ncbi:type VI secretion system baseplate subunit TssG [Sphingomonas sp. 3-13AW]|uniref:type VI secretion system baseplate subunit TssG n=1 Tax=Sphingomonas sp. 3-13AW TaxID=3050450 RepID=UPI003BB58E4A
MARAPRPAADHLSYFARAASGVAGLAPLALLRGAEARAPGLPRIGEAKLPGDDVVKMVHAPSLAFPAATLETIEIAGRRATVEGSWLGLTGPMGPLPLHLTEFAAYERRHARQQPFGRFLDVLAGRMLQFFYRAWAATVPAASVDRGDGDDRFGNQIALLTGATDGAGSESPFPGRARLHHAALFASPRSPAAIGDGIGTLLRLPVRVVEYVERWREVEPEDQTQLGRGFATLGGDALSGARVCTVEDAFAVAVEVGSTREYQDLLPGGERYALLVDALEAFAPPHLDWDITLAIASERVRPTRLGGEARLGWSSWFGPLVPGEIRADAHLGANARRLVPSRPKETAA